MFWKGINWKFYQQGERKGNMTFSTITLELVYPQNAEQLNKEIFMA